MQKESGPRNLNFGTVPKLRSRIEASCFVRGAYSTVPYVAPQPWAASAELIWSHRRNLNFGTVPKLRSRIEASCFVRGAYSTVPYVAPQPWAASAELIWSHRRVRL